MLRIPRVPLAVSAVAIGLAALSFFESRAQAVLPLDAQGQATSASDAASGPSAAQWQALGKTFSFEGHDVFFVDQGSGPVTLAVHGYPTSSWDFRRLLAPISREGRFIAPDLLGFGYSAKPPGGAYTIARQADLVVTLVRNLGIRRVRLIGSDIGNAVVQELLAREREGGLPFAVQSVVLINGSLFADQFQPSTAQKALLSMVGGVVNRTASEEKFVSGLDQIQGPDKRIPASDLSEAWRLLNHPSQARLLHKTLPSLDDRQAHDARWTEALCASTMPLKLVVGGADPTAGKAMAEATTARCKGTRSFALLKLDRAGHFPHVEFAEETAGGILAWHEGGY